MAWCDTWLHVKQQFRVRCALALTNVFTKVSIEQTYRDPRAAYGEFWQVAIAADIACADVPVHQDQGRSYINEMK